jgi:hypothetical protein
MAKYSVSMPQDMMTAAAILLAGEDYDPERYPVGLPGVSAIVQACVADFLLRNKAKDHPHVQQYLENTVGDRFQNMLLEASEP